MSMVMEESLESPSPENISATTCIAAGSSDFSDSSLPKRCIYNDADMQAFLISPAHAELLRVTSAMGRACASENEEDDNCSDFNPQEPLLGLSPPLAALHGGLIAMKDWINEFPPVDRTLARFGNPAFRSWHGRLEKRSASIIFCVWTIHNEENKCLNSPKVQHEVEYDLETLREAARRGSEATTKDLGLDVRLDASEENSVNQINPSDRAILTELCSYFNLAFGHPIRLDYGTGHECSFQVFLFALMKLGCFGGSTPQQPPTSRRLRAATLSLYNAYLGVTRVLQTLYVLEPAGSHGVWGLDDYHCLPFFFGACQLQTHHEYTPSSIHDDSVLTREQTKYLYFDCIHYIKSLKRGAPFSETSPMLSDISRLPTWKKVASGLLRLFEGEVLNKRVVVQHFVFGRIFSANWLSSGVHFPKAAPSDTFRDASALGSSEDPLSVGTTRAPWVTSTAAAKSGSASSLVLRSNDDDAYVTTTKAPWAN